MSDGAQAMVLAAGRGERMRPLTDTCPKPLLEVRGKPLMQYHLEALAEGGIDRVVVNTAWLGEQIEQRFGAAHGSLAIAYSHEGRDFGGAIETAGGIARVHRLVTGELRDADGHRLVHHRVEAHASPS